MKLQQMLEPSGKRAGVSAAMIPLSVPRALGDSLTARAVAHIAEWSTYLPKDCVDAMVRGGWHLTV
jgi:hypothetical protein